jgi:hypothetical protein
MDIDTSRGCTGLQVESVRMEPQVKRSGLRQLSRGGGVANAWVRRARGRGVQEPHCAVTGDDEL